MSDWIQAVVLALVQGLTEFLPISSSGHLILAREVLGWGEGAQSAAFDVAVHVGSLLAVVVYFRKTLVELTGAWFTSLRTRRGTPSSWLAWAVILGTIPAGLAGVLLKDPIEEHLRSGMVVAIASIVFGILLWIADVVGRRQRELDRLSWTDVVVVGFAQALALIPGTSRSGATMTGALFTGLTREAAARYSFLLSIPLILAAGALKSRDAFAGDVNWGILGVGVLVSAVSAYLCIEFFLRLIERIGMLPFVLYRVALGLVLIWLLS